MGMNLYFNNITTDGTEQTLFDVTITAHHAFYIFCNNMQDGDSIRINVYVWDDEAGVYRNMHERVLEDIQYYPPFFDSFLPSSHYKVTIQQDNGTYRSFNWTRVEVT